jgi:hypothetical protein
MKKRTKSRFMLLVVLALATSVTVGLASGSVADAKKKGKKKGKKGGTITLVAGATAIPPAIAPSGGPPPTAEGKAGFVSIPLTVGKKAGKGKVVGWDTLTVTSTFTGSDGQALEGIGARIVAPNGRFAGMVAPVSDAFAQTDPLTGNQVSGPLTETPNTTNTICLRDPGPPPNPPCFFQDQVVGPPSYSGTVRNQDLTVFGGVPAQGTWQLQLFNTRATTTAVMNGAIISFTTKTAPV